MLNQIPFPITSQPQHCPQNVPDHCSFPAASASHLSFHFSGFSFLSFQQFFLCINSNMDGKCKSIITHIITFLLFFATHIPHLTSFQYLAVMSVGLSVSTPYFCTYNCFSLLNPAKKGSQCLILELTHIL